MIKTLSKKSKSLTVAKNKLVQKSPASEILLYQTEDSRSKIQVRFDEGSVWLTQAQIAELFQTTKQNISLHIKNIFDDEELDAQSVVKECLTAAADGKAYSTSHYNLEAILAVGYRVRSRRGTQFRRWATEHLREYLTKGFLLDDERLKDVRNLGPDYFDDLLLRIRDIRASEKRFYQKIRDIYKLAIDYDPKAEETLEFFRIVQNKLHWAVTGMTAAELISGRVDAAKPNMGCKAFKYTPMHPKYGSYTPQNAPRHQIVGGQANTLHGAYIGSVCPAAEGQALRNLGVGAVVDGGQERIDLA